MTEIHRVREIEINEMRRRTKRFNNSTFYSSAFVTPENMFDMGTK